MHQRDRFVPLVLHKPARYADVRAKVEESILSAEDATVIAAVIAAIASVTSLILSTRLSESRDRRRALWELELARFFELEEVAGQLVQDLLAYRCRDDASKAVAEEKREFLHAARGRFLRYDAVAEALGLLHNTTGWYVAQDMKHENRMEFEEARNDVVDSYRKLLNASDAVLKRHPWCKHRSNKTRKADA
jgi:hypothetical protein